MRKNPQYEQPAISNLEELRAAKQALRASIREQEQDLREQVKLLPAESLKAGVGHLFTGKAGAAVVGPLAGLAVSAGSALLGTYFTKKATAAVAGKLGLNLAKTGLVALAPVLLKRFAKWFQ